MAINDIKSMDSYRYIDIFNEINKKETKLVLFQNSCWHQ